MSGAHALLPATARAFELASRRVQHRTRQPSLVAGVLRAGTLVWHIGLGTATGGTARPGPGLAYRIGSLTKTVTAVLVMQDRDAGRLALSDRLGDHLPEAPFPTATIRDLLAHAAGLPAEPEGPWWERRDGQGGFGDLVNRVAAQEPVLPAGQRHHYSNLGYALLGEVVARLASRSWEDLARTRVLDPLGMSSTTYHPTEPGLRSARGYSVHPYTGRLLPEPSTDTGAMAPAGQLWSTLSDLTRWSAFLLEGDESVLADASLAQMRTAAQGDTNGLDVVYGLGLSLTARPTGDRFGHGGSMPGFLAGLQVDPKQQAAAVALSNATLGGTAALPMTLLDLLAEHEPALPDLWEPEPEVPGADELVGEWFWGAVPVAILVQGGTLRLDVARAGRATRLVAAGADRWRGLDAYFAGETLEVHRAPTGTVESLRLATYVFTRRPYQV